MITIMSPVAFFASGSRLIQFDKIPLPYDANIVEHIYKDSYGMIWFATRRGLFSYDGYNTRRLYEGNFNTMVAVNNDLICLGSSDGLMWLDLRTEKLITPDWEVPAAGDVRSLTCFENKLFVGTKARGLFCLDLTKHTWRHYNLPNGRNDIIFSFERADNRLYIAHYNGMVWLDSNGDIHDAGIADNVYDMWYDRKGGCLWIGTEHNLLCRDIVGGATRTVSSGTTYNQVVPSPTGEILLASEYGLNILNPNTGDIQTVGHNASSPRYGLPSNTIHHIYYDGKNIWIATDRGVAVTHTDNTFQTIPLPSVTSSSDGNVFSHILIDSNGGKWLGGDNGLLHITQHATKWFKVGNGLRKNLIRSIYEDRDHDIWIATDASIARYDGEHDRFVYYNLTDRKGRNANWAYGIYEDERARLWIATFMGGMYVVDKKLLMSSSGSVTVNSDTFGKDDDIVSACFRFSPDNQGCLWAYTSKGLVAINTHTMEVTLKQKMYIDNMIYANGIIWLDMHGELYRYDTRTNVRENTGFVIKDGMIHSFVRENNRL